MTSKWNTSGNAVPTGNTVPSDRFAGHKDGIDTAATHFAGTSDPSSGAPTTWGAAEIGSLWFDRTNERYGGGDDIGSLTKIWERGGASSYGWRTIGATSWTAVNDPTNVLDSDNLTAVLDWRDLDLTVATSSYAIRVLLNVEVIDADGADATTLVAFRPNGESTATTQAMRVYPQVATIPTMAQVWMDVDAGQVLEYTVAPSSPTGTGLDLKLDVAAYHERF